MDTPKDKPKEEVRDHKGRFAPGHCGGPGRKRRSPLRDIVTPEKEAELWEAELAATAGADQDRAQDARRFLLRQVAGSPFMSAPDLPPVEWPRIACVADLQHAVNALLGAHAAGDADLAAVGYMADVLVKLAKVFEAVELGPQVAELKRRVAELTAGGKLQPGGR